MRQTPLKTPHLIKFPVLLILSLFITLTGCNSKKVSFTNAISANDGFSLRALIGDKNSVNLSKKLGSSFRVVQENDKKKDTITYQVRFENGNNLIMNSWGDTAFYGNISRYKGLYFMSQKTGREEYLISAFRLKKGHLQGFMPPKFQMIIVWGGCHAGRIFGTDRKEG